MSLVLSLFPGIGLLDRAFEEEGFCVVRGPDLLWGGDIRMFHPPAGRFDGIIGGPPCKRWSPLVNIVRAVHGEEAVAPDLIPEFARVVFEAAVPWFLMENVPAAPEPTIPGYTQKSFVINNRWVGGVQNRLRRFTFGRMEPGATFRVDLERFVECAALEPAAWEPAVCSTAGGRRRTLKIGGSGKPKGNQRMGPGGELRNWTVAEMAALQGLPADFLADSPFTLRGKQEAIGNGVPLPMGRALALAVKKAAQEARG